ncbi:DUF2971 domain-containing protein [Marinobacterium rhizophilum]|uniref:DUF2971 domain-containing protein n=1 Tax=Marinobacterium rhizophilum TaxID=420402 RepID=UPI000A008F44|nr:DUF2971 domain-containing protein [Marinobacterium rhizophilum]
MQPRKVYRYRSFTSLTVDALVRDELFFSDPGAFNDPLDCQPTVEADSGLEELREILSGLISRRIFSETASSLRKNKVKEESASQYASKLAQREAKDMLESITYYSTGPEYDCSREEAEIWLLTVEIERELLKRYGKGVCCFSSVYDNPLLWSHYGDQHKGMCIGYNLTRNPEPRLYKVNYGGSRIVPTSLIKRAIADGDKEARDLLDKYILLRKASPWRYEREWRLLGQRGLQDSPLRMIEITFGLRCSDAVKHSIVSALSNRDSAVKFYEMHEVRGSFKLSRRPIDMGEMHAYYPRVALSGLEIFGPVSD